MPNRILKESVCTSENIDKLSWFEEVLYYRLIVSCDDFGRFDGRCAIIKNRLFPLKESVTMKSVEVALNRLATVGLVALYEVDGKPYLQLPTWGSHQRIRNQKSKYPSPSVVNPLSIDSESQTIAPVIQSNPNPNPNPESEAKRAGLSAAMSAYLDRVNPSASQQSLEELKAYEASMGHEVCLRAIDIAVDEKKATWSYIRGILRRLQSQGVKCIADWDAAERAREGHSDKPSGSFAEIVERMKREGKA